MSSTTKTFLTILLCGLAIAGSTAWIYWHEFRAARHDVELHQRIGEVMAEQAAMVIGKHGKIVLITIPTGGEPELKTQLDAFHARLKTLGNYELREYEMDTKAQDKYAVGTGLSGRRYVRTANKNLDAAVIVSFIGAPHMKEAEIAELQKVPKFVAEVRGIDNLPKLFNKELISVAIAARFSFPAPGPIPPRTAQERFDKRYQIIASTNVATVPKPE